MIRNSRWFLGLLMIAPPAVAQDADRTTQGADSPRAETPGKVTDLKPVMIEVEYQNLVNSLVASGNLDAFGLQVVAADPVLRSQLGLDAAGVVVVSVKPTGLADQAGLKSRDVLTRLGRDPIEDVETLAKRLSELSTSSVEVGLIREGEGRTLSMVGPAHVASPRKFWVGVTVSPVDATLRSHLKTLPADSGLVATDVVEASPAAKAGVLKNDILYKFEGKPITTQDVFVKSIQENQAKPASIELLRRGKVETVKVTPEIQVAANNPFEMIRVVRSGDPNPAFRFYENLDKQPKDESSQAGEGRKLQYYYANTLKNNPNAAQEARGRVITRLKEFQPWEFKDPNSAAVDQRLETQMKELSGKLDEIRKAIESIKAADAK